MIKCTLLVVEKFLSGFKNNMISNIVKDMKITQTTVQKGQNKKS